MLVSPSDAIVSNDRLGVEVLKFQIMLSFSRQAGPVILTFILVTHVFQGPHFASNMTQIHKYRRTQQMSAGVIIVQVAEIDCKADRIHLLSTISSLPGKQSS